MCCAAEGGGVSTGRSTTVRDRDRAAIRRTKPPCGIYLLHGASEAECFIDYSLPHTDPMSYVVDHVIPLSKGGLDELSNKQAAHRRPSLQPRKER